MTLLPQHPASRIAATLWLAACVVFLLVTLQSMDTYTEERSALSRLVPVYFLGFPSAHIAVVTVGKIKLALYLNAQFEPGILAECVSLWTMMLVLGYFQWFILLPWLVRKLWHACNMIFNRKG